MRIPLQPGTITELTFNGAKVKFMIDKIIGDGASCIAYEARRLNSDGSALCCRIKECYPFNAHAERKGLQLIWNDNNKRQKSFNQLKKSHNIIVNLRNNESVGNNITSAELYEGNGTLYSVMEVNHAKTYANNSDTNLHRILETIRVLTEVVGNLHKQGYLHLDIKPDNFLVSHNPNTYIWLFDIDSLTPIEELKNGNVRAVSYSENYASPEQLLGQIKKICPATDLFAIGSILFEKVMGRTVSVEDTGQFAEWDFNAKIFNDVNPKVKRFLRDIFKHTLAASVKKRYQSADELLSALKKACDVTIDGKPFLSSDRLTKTTYFIGRNNELEKIHNAFNSGNHVVFLHGIGGIGKSALSIAYSAQYENDYDIVLFIKYKGSLEEAISDVTVQNFDGDNGEKNRLLKRLLDKRTLLIIDNFDIEIDEDEYLETVLNYKADILFTTRTDFSSVYNGDIQQIEVENLSYNALSDLFTQISGINVTSEENSAIFAKLLKSVDYHTYAVELLARQITASDWSLEELFNKLSGRLSNLSNAEKVRANKDGRRVKQTVPNIIRGIFNIAALSEERCQVLRNLSLLSFLYVDKQTYKEFTCAKATDFDTLNDLIELGWVQKSAINYTLHPLVEELVREDLKPCEENCEAVYARIKMVIYDCVHYDGYNEADEYELENNCNLLCAFFNNVDLNITSNRKLVIEWLMGIDENENATISSPIQYNFEALYNKLEDIIKKGIATNFEVFQISYIIFTAWLFEFNIIYYGNQEDAQKREKNRKENILKTFKKTILCIKQLPENKIEKAYKKLYTNIACFINEYLGSNFPKSIIYFCYNNKPEYFKLSPLNKQFYNLPLTKEDKNDISTTNTLIQKKHSVFDTDEYKTREAYISHYIASAEKYRIILDISNNSTMSFIQRAEIISYCLNANFQGFHIGIHTHYALGWKESQDLLNIETKFLLRDDFTTQNRDEHERWNYCLDMNLINSAIVYAATNQINLYETTLRMILDDLKVYLTSSLSRKTHWSHLLDINKAYKSDINLLINGLTAIHKEAYILPYLIDYTNGWLGYAKKQPDFDERYFFSLYKKIAEIAETAEEEKDMPEKYRLNYMNIWSNYENKMDEITGNNYIIKIPKD